MPRWSKTEPPGRRPARPEPVEGELPSSEREALLRIAAAAGDNDLPRVVEAAAEESLKATPAASVTISRFEDRGENYRVLINAGELAEWETRFPDDEIYAVRDYPRLKRMWQTGGVSFNALDDPGCEPTTARLLRSLNKTSDLEVPIVVEDDIWGGLWAATSGTTARFRGEDIRFLEAVAGQLGGAIARAEMFDRVSRLAYEDSLTGLANRRALEERLERAMARFAAGESSLSLLLCDLDDLKVINDNRGHDRGDKALRSVARTLVGAAAAHPGAFVARLGGDEFCVLLEEVGGVADGDELTSIERLATSAQRLLRIEEADVTVSCGIATSGPQTGTVASLLRAADSAQYAAKRRGGNRICTAGELDRLPVPSVRAGTSAERLAAAAVDVARELVGELAGADVLDRLELVATKIAAAGRFAYWTISIAESGTDFLRDLAIGDLRHDPDDRMLVARAHEGLDSYELDDFPLTASVIEAGTGSFVAEVDDERCDPSERALLEKEGFYGVVGAVSGTDDGVYLLEIFSDDRGSPLQLVSAVLTLAVAAAMPPEPHRRSLEPEGTDRWPDLSLALAERLSGATAEHEVCDCAVEELQRAFGCSLVQVVAVAGDQLEIRAEAGELTTEPGWQQRADAGEAIREEKPVLVRDVSREPQYRATDWSRDVRSELAMSIPVAGKTWGVINLEDTEIGAFSEEDARLLESVAAQIGGALTAIRLYERLDRAYIGTAEALTEALDAKDSYTAEHSRSIAETAAAVGARLGMDGEELLMLRYAAAFHDIGKVAISREVLDKPGPLDDAEWAEIVEHTVIGERILGPIEFLAPIRKIVRAAHERWDGEGYPDGLAGERIPLGARILFACDAYDAMTTDRPYSAAVSDAEARAELERCAGTQLDPDVVKILLEVLDDRNGPVEEVEDLAPRSA